MLKGYQVQRLTCFIHPDDVSGRAPATTSTSRRPPSARAGSAAAASTTPRRSSSASCPRASTDFAFSAFAEQRGFVGAVILLGLYLLVLWRGLRVVTVARDLFSAIAAGGIVIALLFQIFVNVGMTMGIAPITGIPLAVRQRRRLLADREPRGDGRAARDPCARSRLALLAPPLMSGLPVSAAAIRKLLRDIAASGSATHVLAVGGARELAPLLRQQFRRGRCGACGRPPGRAGGRRVYVHVLSGEADDEDVALLRRACACRRAGGRGRRWAPPTSRRSRMCSRPTSSGSARGTRFLLEAIARTIAARLGERGAPLAARCRCSARL